MWSGILHAGTASAGRGGIDLTRIRAPGVHRGKPIRIWVSTFDRKEGFNAATGDGGRIYTDRLGIQLRTLHQARRGHDLAVATVEQNKYDRMMPIPATSLLDRSFF
jgi:hypothetical protein